MEEIHDRLGQILENRILVGTGEGNESSEKGGLLKR
jgi:hypothetical protein